MQVCARHAHKKAEVSFKAYYADPECRDACDRYGIIGPDGKVKKGHGHF